MFSLIDLTIWQLGIELQGFELHHNLTTIMNDGRDYSIRLPIQKVPSGPPCPADVIAPLGAYCVEKGSSARD